MHRPKQSIKTKSFANSFGMITFILLLLFALACTCDLDELGKIDEISGDKEKTEKRPSGKKKKKDDEDKDEKETKSDKNDRGDFIAAYSDVKNDKYDDFNKSMKDQEVLEDIAEKLNKNLSLPTDVTITFTDCGVPNAFYMPNKKLVTVCYEFMDLFYQKFIQMGMSEDEANDKMFGATEFFFLHELGHCLIDVYDLPAVGREEDAVDQLSTYILMEDMSEGGADSAIAGVMIFRALAENEPNSQRQYADEHSLSSQRYYNIACWMYGKDPREYSSFVDKGILPRERAVRCQNEYDKMANAWERLVEPHRKN